MGHPGVIGKGVKSVEGGFAVAVLRQLATGVYRKTYFHRRHRCALWLGSRY